MQPQILSELDTLFPTDVSHLMPNNIPEEFYYNTNPYAKLVSEWFFRGLSKSKLKVRLDINEGDAYRHMKAIMGSWDPSHEDKIASVAYLMSLWFEVV